MIVGSRFPGVAEALHNAVKYCGANHITGEIFGRPNEIYLTAIDRGKGFEVEGTKRGLEMGLVSMQERVHLVHGTFNRIEARRRNQGRCSCAVSQLEPRSVSGAGRIQLECENVKKIS
jgi:nitrate/nitrite-specific signal transduction histidine kinase